MLCGLVDDLSPTDGGWFRGPTHARTPRPQSVRKAGTQCVVCPVVDDWIPATAAHCQPVTRNPHQLDALEVPDGRLKVAKDGDAV